MAEFDPNQSYKYNPLRNLAKEFGIGTGMGRNPSKASLEDALLKKVEEDLALRRSAAKGLRAETVSALQKSMAEKYTDQLMQGTSKRFKSTSEQLFTELEQAGLRISKGLENALSIIENTNDKLVKDQDKYFKLSDKKILDLLKTKNPTALEKTQISSIRNVLVQSQLEGMQKSQDVVSAGLDQTVKAGVAGGVAGLLFGKGGNSAGNTLAHLGLHKLPFGSFLTKVPGISNLLGKISQGGLLGAAVDLAPVLATVEAVKQGAAEYRSGLQSGKITGEGFGAGISAQFHAIKQGLNPFDLVSGEMAQQIINGIRQQGFRDKAADHMANAVGDIINNLGTDMQTTLEMVVTSVRGVGANDVRSTAQAINNFKASMQDLGKTAKDSGVSVTELTTSVQQVLNTAALQGGATGTRAAPLVTQAIQAAYGLKPLPGQSGLAGQMLVGAAPYLAPLKGIIGPEAFTKRGLVATGQELDQIFSQFRAQWLTSGQHIDDFSAIMKAGPLQGLGLGFMSIGQISSMIKGAKPGKFEKALNVQIGSTALNKGLLAMRDEKQKLLKGFPHNVRGANRDAYIASQHQRMSRSEQRQFIFGVEQSLKGQMSGSEIHQLIAPFQAAIGNDKRFNELIHGSTKGGSTGPFNVKVQIELDKNAAKFFKANTITQAQNWQQFVQGNTGYPYKNPSP